MGGRTKQQMSRGGSNIAPAEVEAALLRHPAIAKASLVAVPEKRLGAQACAMCCLRGGDQTAPDLNALKKHFSGVDL